MTIRTELGEGLVVCVDRNAVRQILLNLLDNAVKYGPPGQTVTVATTAAGDSVRIRVDDEGPGIPAKDRRHVWERFWRLAREEESAVAGTGIGLAVVHELTAQHGGRAWCEEAPGVGARFLVELPRTEVLTPEPAAPPEPALETASAPAGGGENGSGASSVQVASTHLPTSPSAPHG